MISGNYSSTSSAKSFIYFGFGHLSSVGPFVEGLSSSRTHAQRRRMSLKREKRVESAKKDRDKSTARVENRGVRAVREEKRREGKEESAGIPNL